MDNSAQISTQFFGSIGCYIYKTQLREYTRMVGILTPKYITIKEGPSHEPCFKSTVIVDSIMYESLPGFPKRKASEQSAAEIALIGLAKLENGNEIITSVLHESGVCKELLQQYAQRMKYELPCYVCRYNVTADKLPFTCSVMVGDTQYTGASAKSNRAAQINAARSALLTFQSSYLASKGDPYDNPHCMVIPKKRNKLNLTCKKTTCHNPKMTHVWRKVEKSFPSNVFAKLKTFVTKQEVGDTEDTGFLLKGLEVPVAKIDGNGTEQNVTATEDTGFLLKGLEVPGAKKSGLSVHNVVNQRKQPYGIQAECAGKVAIDVKHGESSMKWCKKVVLPKETSNTAGNIAVDSSQQTDVACTKKMNKLAFVQNETKPKKAQQWVERKFPVDLFDKLKTYVAKEEVSEVEDIYGMQVRDSGVPVADLDGSFAHDDACEPKNELQATGAHIEYSGMLSANVRYGEANMKGNGRVVLPGETTDIFLRDGAVSMNLDQTLQDTPNLGILSQFSSKDLLALAAEIHKICGVGAVAPQTTTSSNATAARAPFKVKESKSSSLTSYY